MEAEMTDELDIPSPIDLRDPHDAAVWIAEADAKRPWRSEMRAAFCAELRALPAPLRILETGPGPGLLAEAILARCDVARYVLFDFSPPMLEYCRARLGDRAVRVLGDYTRDDWPALVAADAPFDALVSMQSAHELRHKRH